MIDTPYLIIIISIALIVAIYMSKKIHPHRKIVTSEGADYITNSNDYESSLETLQDIRNRINVLRRYLIENLDKYPDFKPYFERLYHRTDNILLQEKPDDEQGTSYTINKGEKMVICLRSPVDQKIYDVNTIMYVVLHELSHIACPEYGHTNLFKMIFVSLIKISNDLGIYHIVNYKNQPHEYCGITISENLLK